MASDESSTPRTSDMPDPDLCATPTPRLAPEDINLIVGAVADILCNSPADSGNGLKNRYYTVLCMLASM